MKIYCILLDAFPYNGVVLNKFSNAFGLNLIRQITSCFTKTSCISMFTGKLPSDLIEGGIGYKTNTKFLESYKNQYMYVEWPFSKDIIFEKLKSAGFDIHFHNNSDFCRKAFYHNTYAGTTGYIGGVENEFENGWAVKDVFNMLLNNKEYEKNEIELIKNIIGKKNNTMYFVILNHVHAAYQFNSSLNKMMSNSFKLLSNFNFNEPDTFFWIFSDHGNFNLMNEYIKPEDYHMWTMYKNNTDKKLELPNLISITDFHDIVNTLFVENKDEFILKEDPNRVYFVEDSRAHIDPFKSTSFVSCLEKNNEIHQALKILGKDKIFYNKNDNQVNNILKTELLRKFKLKQ